ncbi:MAG TPA: VOC family protein [Bryobacteraceae bacterium]|nr:VOC family protein [Bryobacteraceae bacterium]
MTPAPQFGLSTIGQIAVTVKDIGRAVEFYRDQLGMRFLFQAPGMAFFDCGGVRLLLGLPEANQETFRSIIYFKVEDIQAATDTLKSRGVVFERDPHLVARMPDHDLWLAVFRDPDQNPLELMCEVKRA